MNSVHGKFLIAQKQANQFLVLRIKKRNSDNKILWAHMFEMESQFATCMDSVCAAFNMPEFNLDQSLLLLLLWLQASEWRAKKIVLCFYTCYCFLWKWGSHNSHSAAKSEEVKQWFSLIMKEVRTEFDERCWRVLKDCFEIGGISDILCPSGVHTGTGACLISLLGT